MIRVCSASSPPTELRPQHRSWHSFLSNDFGKVLYLQLIGSKVGLKYLQADQNCDINSLTQDHWSDQSDSHTPHLPSLWNVGTRDEKSRKKQENWAWWHEEDLDWSQPPEIVSKQKPGWSSNDPESKCGARREKRGQWRKESLGQMPSFVRSWSLGLQDSDTSNPKHPVGAPRSSSLVPTVPTCPTREQAQVGSAACTEKRSPRTLSGASLASNLELPVLERASWWAVPFSEDSKPQKTLWENSQDSIGSCLRFR